MRKENDEKEEERMQIKKEEEVECLDTTEKRPKRSQRGRSVDEILFNARTDIFIDGRQTGHRQHP